MPKALSFEALEARAWAYEAAANQLEQMMLGGARDRNRRLLRTREKKALVLKLREEARRLRIRAGLVAREQLMPRVKNSAN